MVEVGRTVEIDAGAKRLDRLYRRFSRRVRWVVRARGVPEASLDDVVHDAFLRIFRKLPERDRDIPITHWVDGVARNVAFTHQRTRARRARRDARAPHPHPVLEPDEALARKDAWSALQTFLEALDPEQREAFIHSDILQTPVPEIARATGVKLNTVYSRVRIARRRFAEHFGDAPDPVALRSAMKQERRGAEQSRRAMALLLVDLGLGGNVAQAATATAGLGLLKVAGLAAAGLGLWKVATVALPSAPPSPAQPAASASTNTPRSSPDSARRSARSPEATSSPSPSHPDPSAPVVAALAVDSSASATTRPSAVAPAVAPSSIPSGSHPRAPLAKPAPPELQTPDPLAAEVALLAQARAYLGQGRPAEALRMVEAHRNRFPRGVFRPQRRGIERDAACATGNEQRARRAARALGVADSEPVCGTPKKTKAP